jgi:hypothetical protein
MSAARFILRYTGKGPIPARDRERIRDSPGAHILDDSSRMLLVEAPEDTMEALISSMPDWVSARERTIKMPDPRPKLRS